MIYNMVLLIILIFIILLFLISNTIVLFLKSRLKKLYAEKIFWENFLEQIDPTYHKTMSQNKQKQSSIVDEICNKKIMQFNSALLLVSVSGVFYCCTNIIFRTDIPIKILIFLSVLILLILMLKLLVPYRIKKGYYGTNYEECKELMHYIIDDIDNNDKNRGKKIFNEINDYNKARETNATVVGKLKY